MTNGATDRLDRIEALLAQIAESNAASTARLDRIEGLQAENTTAIASMQTVITEGFRQTREEIQAADRISRERLEETTADVVAMIGDLGTEIREASAIAASNARAVQAWESRINEVEEEAQEPISQLQVDVRDLGNWIQALIAERREDWRQWREEWRTRQAESDQRFENLLQDARADRQEWRQRFDEQTAEMQADRESNANQFQAALELIRGLFLEIQELWREFRAG